MIELVIAMVLACIVFGGLVEVATLMFGSAKNQTLHQTSSANNSDVTERFERDVHGAESLERVDATKNRDDMRALILNGKTTFSDGSSGTVPQSGSSEPCGTSRLDASSYCQYEDITLATPTLLMFRSDVVSTNTGGECVAWSVESGALWRRVYDGQRRCRPGNTGALLESDQMLQAPRAGMGVAGGTDSARLSYLVRYNQNAFASGTAYIDPARCVSTPDTSRPNPRERAFIVSVTIDLAAWTTDGPTDARSTHATQTRATTSGALTGRISDDYAYWTGCGL